MCSCDDGYLLQADGRTCAGMHSVCETTYVVCVLIYTQIVPPFSDVLFKNVFIDIDECQTDNGGCSQTCNNTDGSYQCSCRNGYELTNDGHNCTGKWTLIIVSNESICDAINAVNCVK